MSNCQKIIAIDGNVYTGKTSIINKICKEKNWNCIMEYSHFFNESNFKKLSQNEIQKKYLETEKRRKIHVNKSKINIIDRSIISQAAHIFVSYRMGISDLREEFMSTIISMKNNKDILIPDLFVLIKCDFEISKRRFLKREVTNKKKNTDSKLISKEYFNLFNEFVIKFADIIIDTSKPSLRTSTNELINSISTIKVKNCVNLIKDIEGLFFDSEYLNK